MANDVIPRQPALDGEVLPPAPPKRQPVKFTQTELQSLPPGRYWWNKKGLYLLVRPNGVRRWVLRYRRPNGTWNETGLGEWPAVDVKLAERKAIEAQRLLEEGKDPVEAKRAKRAAAVTFREIAERWLVKESPGWRSESRKRAANNLIYNHGRPLLDKPVASITDNDVEKALTELRSEHPYQARLALAMWANVFTYAKAYKLRTGDNPCDWKENHKLKWPKAPKSKHFPSVPYANMPNFMALLRREQARSLAATCLEVAILTATRISEATGMRRNELFLGQQLWIIPDWRTKSNREFPVPLTARVVELLARQLEYSDGSEFVFPNMHGNKPMDSKSPLYIAKKIDKGSTVHGFRATFRTWANDQAKFDWATCEIALAHVTGDATAQAYQRGDAFDKRKKLMQEWAAFCDGK
jgi:integrase